MTQSLSPQNYKHSSKVNLNSACLKTASKKCKVWWTDTASNIWAKSITKPDDKVTLLVRSQDERSRLLTSTQEANKSTIPLGVQIATTNLKTFILPEQDLVISSNDCCQCTDTALLTMISHTASHQHRWHNNSHFFSATAITHHCCKSSRDIAPVPQPSSTRTAHRQCFQDHKVVQFDKITY